MFELPPNHTKILTISGSSRTDSSNTKLLDALSEIFSHLAIERYPNLDKLPLFRAEDDHHPWPAAVLDWRKKMADCDTLIISTPEYIHNLPALIKNALEWLTSSGELAQKRVLAITFTPHPPRGEKAMQSLLWSLQALDAHIVGKLPLYQNEITFDENGIKMDAETLEVLKMAMSMIC